MAVLLSDIDETIRKIFLTRNFKIKILRAYILCSNIDTLENILNCSVLKQYHLSIEIRKSNYKYHDIVYSKERFKHWNVAELNKIITSYKRKSN